MQQRAISVKLTATEAACVRAIRDGVARKAEVAIRTRRDLRTVAAALDALNRSELVLRTSTGRWIATDSGRSCVIGWFRIRHGAEARRLAKSCPVPPRSSFCVS
jgi:hypothetical protein